MSEAPEKFVFYAYQPSIAGAVIFVVLFGLSTLWHIKQIVQTRTWFFIPFLVGCLCKFRQIRLSSLAIQFNMLGPFLMYATRNRRH